MGCPLWSSLTKSQNRRRREGWERAGRVSGKDGRGPTNGLEDRRNCNSASRRKRLRRRGWEAEKLVQAQQPEPEGGREGWERAGRVSGKDGRGPTNGLADAGAIATRRPVGKGSDGGAGKLRRWSRRSNLSQRAGGRRGWARSVRLTESRKKPVRYR